VACTTDSAAPTLDTVAALPMLLLTAVWALEAVNANECKFVCISTGAAIGISVGSAALATLFIASATTGNDRIADCRRAQQQPNWRLQRTGRYILDVNAIAEARAREASESR